MPVNRLKKLLNPNSDGGLADIIRHARDMGELVQVLQEALPKDHATSIAAANIRDCGELVILASSSAWASRLRFEEEALIAAAQKSGAVVSSCTIRVNREG